MTKIENEIAEDILQTYAQTKWQYQSERNKFFKQNIVKSNFVIKKNQEKYDKKKESLQRKSEYKKLSKRYGTIV